MMRHRIRAAATVLVLGLPLAAGFPRPEAGRAAQYELEQTDRREEQRKFLAKLKADKVKIDLAIENTKKLIDRSRQRPYLPELYLRLAEIYIEKSRVVYFIRKAEMPEGVKSLDHLESNTLKKQAIEVYQRILNNFPDYTHRDKVRFFMAHEYRELGQIEEMLAQYRELIQRHKTSAYAPEAYLLLGDHFFNTQDLEMARRHYEAVLGYEDSPAVPVARYKLGWCHINEADWKGAIKLFEEAVATTNAQREIEIDTYRKVDIKLESLIDMAYCYGEEYKEATPEEAIAYFERYAWSRPVLNIALEKLAYRFFIKRKWSHAASVYRKLSTLRNDPEKLLEYAGRIFECVREIGNFESADEDMALIVKALRKQKYSAHIPQEEKEKNLTQYELYARDIVTHLHHKAREEKSADGFRLASGAYRAYLEFFEDSEVREEMEKNFAEALFAGKEYLEAGKQFEKLAGVTFQTEPEQEENLYSAVLSYYHALKQKEDLGPYERVFARAGLRSAGSAYVATFPESDKVPNVSFNVAWVAYDEGKFQVAIEEFSRFVEAYPTRPEAGAAVHLVLDAFNLREDYEGLIAYGQKVIGNTALDPKLRSEVSEIVAASESKVLYPLALAAVDDWESGKQELLEFASQHRSSSLGEQALQTVVASSSEMRDLQTLFSAGLELLQRRSEPAKVEETLNLFIDTCLRASQFRQLAHFLEEFAYRLPEHRSSPEFLLKAAQMRQVLGDYAMANNDYTLLLGKQGGKGPDRNQLVFEIAENAIHQADFTYALQVLRESTVKFDGAERVRAEAKIAALYLRADRTKEAQPFLAEARKRYRKNLELWDVSLKDAVAEMEYARLEEPHARFLQLQLGATIDNDIVKQKGELLTSLLEGYHEVMRLQRPRWALAACYRAYEIHEEFARFLKEAPLPDLPAEQQEQYLGIVAQKAEAYLAKGGEYLKKCTELARKWEICDPELARYFLVAAPGEKTVGFAGPVNSVVASERWLTDEGLRTAHLHALEKPGDLGVLNQLANHYVTLGDYRHAVLIAKRALEDADGDSGPARASLLNTLGVARLYCNQDQQAKEAFQEALEADPGHVAARVNLAALYRHYGHDARAESTYDGLDPAEGLDDRSDLIHPKSREIYNAFHQYAKR